MNFINILFFVPFILVINFFLRKNNLLLSNTGKTHQNYASDNQAPLSGGIFIIIFSILYIDSYIILLFLSLLFCVGFFADINFFNSPLKRFFFQIILITTIIVVLDIKIYDVRINYINQILNLEIYNIIFCTFCFLVLINGSNFIDGNNCLSIGYYLIINIILLKIIDNTEIEIFINIKDFILFLTIILIFNFYNKLYLGDSGIYLLSFITGYIIVTIYSQVSHISPYYIVNLLWYPSFEILFSIIRKFKKKYSPLRPDTHHLHQLLFFLIKNKYNFNKIFINSYTGLIINSYFLFILFFSSTLIKNTLFQICILFFNTLIYSIIYRYLNKFYIDHKLEKLN